MDSSTKPRVVFDCNILLQALANPAGPAGKALRLLFTGQIDVLLSRATIREFRQVMQYPAVRQKFPGIKDQEIHTFVAQLGYRAIVVREVPHTFDYPRAVQDEPYIDLAAHMNAEYLVSPDHDLLALATDHSPTGKEFRQRFPRLRVVTPVDFLLSIEAASGP